MFLKMAPLSWFAGVHKKEETIFAENNWVLGLSLEKKIFISTDWWSFKATVAIFQYNALWFMRKISARNCVFTAQTFPILC